MRIILKYVLYKIAPLSVLILLPGSFRLQAAYFGSHFIVEFLTN